ncbi:beta-ketoacyl synthase N-terminal-like domain-containing protein [soil metagenome]
MPVYLIADNIVSPLGNTTSENFDALLQGHSGIRLHSIPAIHNQPFYASLLLDIETEHDSTYTRFERMLIRSISKALNDSKVDITSASTGLVIATTKGNISLIESENYPEQKLPLHYSASMVAAHFGHPNKPVVVSNACISGLTALITGKRMIDAGQYKNVVVAGADAISAFVFSGFNAFQAVSPAPCKPYDSQRSGVTLGEAAATIILSAEGDGIRLTGSAGSNDANHISGPSRTGRELSIAMKKAMTDAGIGAGDIDFISAHGTATLYNDEMEAKAITLAALQTVPVNSMKGYYGHTLGAAGILESVIAIQSIKTDTILPTLGFTELGVSELIAVSPTLQHKKITHCLKTASGFGGCNAAVIFSN